MFTSKADVSIPLPESHCPWTVWLLARLQHLVLPMINTQSYIGL